MSTEIHVKELLAGPAVLFADRADAGRALANWLELRPDPDSVVFALPRGGIPVGRPIADALGCELLPVLVRKLPIPSDPEMGFGAVTIDGDVQLNHPVIEAFGISERIISDVVAEVRAEIERRRAVYQGGWPLPNLAGKRVWLVDDGLATGLTMLAAAQMLRAHSPASLNIAVPCSPWDSIRKLSGAADTVWCLAEQESQSFAVASFYRDFHELNDDEVRAALRG